MLGSDAGHEVVGMVDALAPGEHGHRPRRAVVDGDLERRGPGAGHDLEPGPNPPDAMTVLVEIPRGSRNKYELDKSSGLFRLDRVLYSAVPYPGDYGFFPRSYALDDDPLDALVMVTVPTFPGCAIVARPIALFRMTDLGEMDEKVLWGDLADVLHLIVAFHGVAASSRTPAIGAVRDALIARHFDAVHLAGYSRGRVGFISPEFQALMLEIWKVKFLALPRFTEVIRSTRGVRLDHFLNDGDSPDIPIPVYVGYLNQIREMALEGAR